MKKALMVLLFLGICLLFYSCASAPKARVIQTAFPIDAPYDEVWSALIETFAEMQFSIDNMEKDSGLITTGWLDITGEDNEGRCDCGGLGMNVENQRQVKFNVFVKKTTENSCELKVNCMFEQTYYFAADEHRTLSIRRCVSTGLFEREMFEMVSANLSR